MWVQGSPCLRKEVDLAIGGNAPFVCQLDELAFNLLFGNAVPLFRQGWVDSQEQMVNGLRGRCKLS
jgi:hypothetical protein